MSYDVQLLNSREVAAYNRSAWEIGFVSSEGIFNNIFRGHRTCLHRQSCPYMPRIISIYNRFGIRCISDYDPSEHISRISSIIAHRLVR